MKAVDLARKMFAHNKPVSEIASAISALERRKKFAKWLGIGAATTTLAFVARIGISSLTSSPPADLDTISLLSLQARLGSDTEQEQLSVIRQINEIATEKLEAVNDADGDIYERALNRRLLYQALDALADITINSEYPYARILVLHIFKETIQEQQKGIRENHDYFGLEKMHRMEIVLGYINSIVNKIATSSIHPDTRFAATNLYDEVVSY